MRFVFGSEQGTVEEQLAEAGRRSALGASLYIERCLPELIITKPVSPNRFERNDVYRSNPLMGARSLPADFPDRAHLDAFVSESARLVATGEQASHELKVLNGHLTLQALVLAHSLESVQI